MEGALLPARTGADQEEPPADQGHRRQRRQPLQACLVVGEPEHCPSSRGLVPTREFPQGTSCSVLGSQSFSPEANSRLCKRGAEPGSAALCSLISSLDVSTHPPHPTRSCCLFSEGRSLASCTLSGLMGPSPLVLERLQFVSLQPHLLVFFCPGSLSPSSQHCLDFVAVGVSPAISVGFKLKRGINTYT